MTALRPNGRPPALSAEAVLLLDPEGRTIYAKNAGVERAPASFVKLMTLYLACEAIEAHQFDPDELVTVSVIAVRTIPVFLIALVHRG